MRDPTAISTDGGQTEEFQRWQNDTARALASADGAHVDLYVRSMLPPPGAKDAQTDVLAGLWRAADGTPIDDVAVTVWGERICRCEACLRTQTGRAMLDTVREFEEWGESYDASATSFFERVRHESSLTGETYTGIVPPRVTAALYVEDSLSGVFPVRFGETAYSVTDFSHAISRLAAANAVSDVVDPTY